MSLRAILCLSGQELGRVLGPAVHSEARENLLTAMCVDPATRYVERHSYTDLEVLSLYGDNGLRMGLKSLKG